MFDFDSILKALKPGDGEADRQTQPPAMDSIDALMGPPKLDDDKDGIMKLLVSMFGG